MSELETLVKLQSVDSEIDQTKSRLDAIRATLGPSAELTAARAAAETAQNRLQALEARQRQLEWDVDDRANKIKELSAKLYSGTIKAPKELSGLQTEIEHLKTSLGEVEEQALGVMAEVDGARAAAKARAAELAAVEERWKAAQTDLRAEGRELTGVMEKLRPRRQEIAADVPAALMTRYEELRRIRAGIAVARVERNTCLGCRTTLATSEVQAARQGKISACSACRRILYVAH